VILPDSTARRLSALVKLLLVAGWTAAIVWSAWAADDAFITLRTVDNALNGYGLRWNVAERVQAYTHPLWMFATLGATWLAGSAYHAVLWLAIVCSAAVVGLILWRVANGVYAALLAVLLLASSRAFLDYSTSGLENPLTHLLLVSFGLAWWRLPASPRKTFWLALIVAGVMLNRVDAGLLVLPALAAAAWQRPLRPHVVAIAGGFLPFAAWEVFSVVYYGFPFPNTAYAKLSTGIPQLALLQQAVHYFTNSLQVDTPTLLTIGAALGLTVAGPMRAAWPLSAGIALYLVYIFRIGGDFMAGRFFAAPLLMAALIVVRGPLPRRLAPQAALAGAVVAAWGAAASVDLGITMPHGITDQRRLYSEGTRLVTQGRHPLEHRPEVQRGLGYRDGRAHIVEWGMVGMTGFFVGPAVHVIDTYALADPLLARRPASPRWRIGHFERIVPSGYRQSVRTGENRLENPVLARYYDDLLLATRGPLWTMERWRAIARLNLQEPPW
jgi:arabinofuranosyltransferase